jgi:hypothetical protein
MLTTINTNALIPKGATMAKEAKKIKIILRKSIRRQEISDDKTTMKILPPGTVLELTLQDANELLFSNKALEHTPENVKAVKEEIEKTSAAAKPAKKEKE